MQPSRTFSSYTYARNPSFLPSHKTTWLMIVRLGYCYILVSSVARASSSSRRSTRGGRRSLAGSAWRPSLATPSTGAGSRPLQRPSSPTPRTTCTRSSTIVTSLWYPEDGWHCHTHTTLFYFAVTVMKYTVDFIYLKNCFKFCLEELGEYDFEKGKTSVREGIEKSFVS